MKITAFNPLIVTPKAEEVVALFEELGFERAHTKEGINGHVTSVDLKLGEDFRVNVAQSEVVPQDLTAIRMNVRDFQEAYDFLVSKGFKNAQGDRIAETSSSMSALMVSPSGFAISLSYHKRK
ncbi:MAG: hypothetical protein Q4A07_05580 [Coriobacteriales bacterium]|nr:hypothetical protein [Coriobacteriales bacterium]